ncbi:sugar phosphate isomerase/epimerase family protein [Goodfellowiella coeruleoviolacea]|uniref:D-psicose/D-tagatose/L-ribulose 3-epimerase n=1 Tax=Goodfellowiella coeruleoviolacea TaxID=334858 RepID=A0AAE3KHW1_9PSEU|nr:sugar phosphate isomerase/epimerase family protein [Goodfellowiella coeruleoviolacea]MCP2166834.1 D-psicose/D-tagatose/L-ribulose 3-epimerase [Goodfellowiella coeruleoviolacea]
MNKIGLHASVWVGDWSADSARTAVESTAKAGYDLIEIPALDPSSIDTKLTRQLLADNGLDAGFSLGLRWDADISSTDPEVVKRGRDLLAGALTTTVEVGAGYLGGVLFSTLGKYPAPLDPRGRENVVRSLASLAADAADAGVTIGLEVVNRYESNVLNTAEQAVALIEDIGADNVVVHLDTYHMNIEEQDFATPVERTGAKLGYVHIGESHRGYLGTGTINFPQLFSALKRADYQGPITFESFSSAVVNPDLSNNLAVWRNLWSDSTDLATHAHKFIVDGLAAAS